MKKTFQLKIASLVMIGLLLIGCSNSTDINTASGKVSYSGTPVQGIEVVFQSLTNSGSFKAQTDEQGNYVVDSAGFESGEYKVHLVWPPGSEPVASNSVQDSEKMNRVSGKVPSPYREILELYGNPETTPMIVNVNGNQQNLNIILD